MVVPHELYTSSRGDSFGRVLSTIFSKMKIALPLAEATRLANEFGKKLGKKYVVAGSIRRRVPTVGDVDLMYYGDARDAADVKGAVATETGPSRTTVIYRGTQFNVYRAEPEYDGPMLLFATGGKTENIIMRSVAKKRGMKLSQFGLFDRDTDERLDDNTERGIYRMVGVTYRDPEDRR